MPTINPLTMSSSKLRNEELCKCLFRVIMLDTNLPVLELKRLCEDQKEMNTSVNKVSDWLAKFENFNVASMSIRSAEPSHESGVFNQDHMDDSCELFIDRVTFLFKMAK